MKANKRINPPTRDPKERIKDFLPCVLPYSEEDAIKEASRCLDCKDPLCVNGCPINNPIPEFINLIKEGKFLEAAQLIVEKGDVMPSVCGRVCQHEKQCEGACILNKVGEPVAIGALEFFVGDKLLKELVENKVSCVAKEKKGKKVALVGSGPASFACAFDLLNMGYEVDIYEKYKGILGGVPKYGIPDFRLERKIVDMYMKLLENKGARFIDGCEIGKDKLLKDLLKEYDAVFLGAGANKPYGMGIKGEDLKGVYLALDFLFRSKFDQENLKKELGKKLIVVGGGFTAIDVARTAVRLGVEKVIIVYRRTQKEMPAGEKEVKEALEEGVEIWELHNPVEFIGENGKLKKVKLIKMRLGEPDSSGRRRPIPIEGSEFEVEVDNVVLAIGQEPDLKTILKGMENEVKYHKKWNCLIVDENQMTNVPGLFAGGDIVRGSYNVISAILDGRKAAKGIDKYLSNK